MGELWYTFSQGWGACTSVPFVGVMEFCKVLAGLVPCKKAHVSYEKRLLENDAWGGGGGGQDPVGIEGGSLDVLIVRFCPSYNIKTCRRPERVGGCGHEGSMREPQTRSQALAL